jgi:hypothetical protein
MPGHDEHALDDHARRRRARGAPRPRSVTAATSACAQGVARQHGALGHALGARGAHVVVADAVDAARRAGGAPRGRAPQRERGRGEHEVPQPVDDAPPW